MRYGNVKRARSGSLKSMIFHFPLPVLGPLSFPQSLSMGYVVLMLSPLTSAQLDELSRYHHATRRLTNDGMTSASQDLARFFLARSLHGAVEVLLSPVILKRHMTCDAVFLFYIRAAQPYVRAYKFCTEYAAVHCAKENKRPQ